MSTAKRPSGVFLDTSLQEINWWQGAAGVLGAAHIAPGAARAEHSPRVTP